MEVLSKQLNFLNKKKIETMFVVLNAEIRWCGSFFQIQIVMLTAGLVTELTAAELKWKLEKQIEKVSGEGVVEIQLVASETQHQLRRVLGTTPFFLVYKKSNVLFIVSYE